MVNPAANSLVDLKSSDLRLILVTPGLTCQCHVLNQKGLSKARDAEAIVKARLQIVFLQVEECLSVEKVVGSLEMVWA